MIKHENIEIVPARDEHILSMKSTLMELYFDEPIYNTLKITSDKLDGSLFSIFTKDDFTLVAVDKSNEVVASIINNQILTPDDMINQKINDGKRISAKIQIKNI